MGCPGVGPGVGVRCQIRNSRATPGLPAFRVVSAQSVSTWHATWRRRVFVLPHGGGGYFATWRRRMLVESSRAQSTCGVFRYSAGVARSWPVPTFRENIHETAAGIWIEQVFLPESGEKLFPPDSYKNVLFSKLLKILIETFYSTK